MIENTEARGRERFGIRGSVVLVVSPHAGQAASEMSPAQALAAAGVRVAEQIRVGDLDEHHPLGAEWRAQGYQAVVAAGGDGTIGTVATQIAGSGLPLGILPLGTSNDTARALGIPLDLDAASAVVAQGTPRQSLSARWCRSASAAAPRWPRPSCCTRATCSCTR